MTAAPALWRVQNAIRDRALAALARDSAWVGPATALAFREPIPLSALDFLALEFSRALAEALPGRPGPVRRLMAARGAAPLAVIGDSHSTHLVRRSWREGRWRLPLHLLCTGASARGLGNPEARGAAGPKARAFLAALAESPIPTVFKFGQVDVEFVFNFKRMEGHAYAFDPAHFEGFTAGTIKRYVAYLVDAVPAALKPMVRIAGVFPPALSDRAWRQGYMNAHIADLHGPADRASLAASLARLEIPDLPTRTFMHAAFNAKLFEAVRAEGFDVLDTFAGLLGPDGTLASRYLGRAQGANHHLGYAASRTPLVEALWD